MSSRDVVVDVVVEGWKVVVVGGMIGNNSFP